MHLITAYKNSTSVHKYIHKGKSFGNTNIFENYFINKKESLFQIVLALNLTNFVHQNDSAKFFYCSSNHSDFWSQIISRHVKKPRSKIIITIKLPS